MKFDIVKQHAGQILSSHGATVLTAGGVIGTITTAVMAARASFKASSLIQEAETAYALEADGVGKLDTKDKVKAVWPVYVPPVLLGTATVGSIVGANMVSARKAAALAAAYAITDDRFAEYRAKVSEKLTGPKQQQIQDEIAQDKVNSNPPTGQVLILTSGDVLCFDMYTGRYFNSTIERIKQAEVKINQDIFHHQYASLSSFYEAIGLEPTTFTDEVGWNNYTGGPLEIRFSTTTTPDGKPCIAIDFVVPPRPEYQQNY